MTTMTNNTETEVLTPKVGKLDVEVRRRVGSLHDIKVTLTAMDAKYDHILPLILCKTAQEGSSNINAIDHNGQLQPCITRLDFKS